MAELNPELVEYAAHLTFDLGPTIDHVQNILPDRIHRIRESLHRLRHDPNADPKTIRLAEAALKEADTDVSTAFEHACVAEALTHVNEDLEMTVTVDNAGVYLHREHLLENDQIFPHVILNNVEGARNLMLHMIAEAAATHAVEDRCRNLTEREREQLVAALEQTLETRLAQEAFSPEPLPERSDDELFE